MRIQAGPGAIVTGTFVRDSAEVLDLQIAGLAEPLGVTAQHRFWSEDRQDFVPAGELRKDGRPIKLQPQPGRILALLAANAGRLVTRDEIRAQIWSGDTFVDFDQALNYCITQIRAALGDDPKAPKYVETLQRRGYRFVASVERLASAPVATAGKVVIAV